MSNGDELKDKLSKENWYHQKQYFDLENHTESEVQILPDKSVNLGNFRPSKIQPGTYYAHPTTIKAMKKNIFVAGNIDELAEAIICHSCQAELDKQFWHFCPYCESGFKD